VERAGRRPLGHEILQQDVVGGIEAGEILGVPFPRGARGAEVAADQAIPLEGIQAEFVDVHAPRHERQRGETTPEDRQRDVEELPVRLMGGRNCAEENEANSGRMARRLFAE